MYWHAVFEQIFEPCWHLYQTAPSNGYAICKYINWTGIPGSVCDKNKYHQHLHVFMKKAHFYNLTRFRMGAWKIKVNSIHLHHINRTNVTVVFVLRITIPTRWRMKSTVRNMTPVDRNILISYWVIWVLRISVGVVLCCVVLCCVVLCCVVLCCVVLSKVSAVRVRAGC